MLKFIKTNWKKIASISLMSIILLFIVLYSIPITRYLLTQGYYQAKVLFSRKSIKSLLADPRTSPELRKKLELVGEIKQFGRSIGLSNTDSYTTVYDTGGLPAVYMVMACRKDRFESHIWKFPIVGNMPYLGFFKKADADKEAEKLNKKGYDVVMGAVTAYSTAGMLPDPLYSSVLLGNEEYLANTILHEMTHDTFFVKSETAFNESLATFIGNQGGIEFIKEKYGEKSKILYDSLASKHDEEIFAEFMADLYDRLNNLYSSSLTSDEMINMREKVFEEAKVEFKEKIIPRMQTENYNGFPQIKLNNAYIMYNRYYHKEYNVLDDIYKKEGSDLKKMIAYLKTIVGPDIRNKIEEIKREKSQTGFKN